MNKQSIEDNFEKDPILCELLCENLDISTHIDFYIKWKKDFSSILDNFNDRDLPKLYSWCISKLDTRLQNHMEHPYTQYNYYKDNIVSWTIKREDILSDINNRIAYSYRLRINYISRLHLTK